jgi:hypothetical protein
MVESCRTHRAVVGAEWSSTANFVECPSVRLPAANSTLIRKIDVGMVTPICVFNDGIIPPTKELKQWGSRWGGGGVGRNLPSV